MLHKVLNDYNIYLFKRKEDISECFVFLFKVLDVEII